ncbi:hypothetical protein GE09DRAFT_1251915 [Coniochaeta sp. 2T2.1]|nr:hypothetical protein GE09DRAFT_1251915 [Coniochaeta sp. 2T2.1]
MRYTLLTSLISLLLLACCGASANPDGLAHSDTTKDLSEKAWYHVFPTPNSDYTATSSFIMATLDTDHLDKSTDADDHSIVTSWTVEANIDQDNPIGYAVCPKEHHQQDKIKAVAAWLKALTGQEPLEHFELDNSLDFWTLDMTLAQADQVAKNPDIEWIEVDEIGHTNGVIPRAVEMPTELDAALSAASNESQSKQQRAGPIEFVSQKDAVTELVAVSQPSTVPDISNLNTYEKHGGSKSFIYHLEEGVLVKDLSQVRILVADTTMESILNWEQEFPKVAPARLQTLRAIQTGLQPDAPPPSFREHTTCTADKALGQEYGVAKGATLVVVQISRDAVTEVLDGLRLIVRDLMEHPERQKHSVVTASIAFLSKNTDLKMRVKNTMELIMNMDVPVVVSAGNAGNKPGRHFVDEIPAVLATPDFPLVVVGSVNQKGELSKWSQDGPKITTRAVGEAITCYYGLTVTHSQQGTSYSAPQVAGQIAVWLSYDTVPQGIDTSSGKLARSMRDYLATNPAAGWEREIGVRVLWNGVTESDVPFTSATLKKECFDIASRKYVERDLLRAIIEDKFCPDFVGHGSISRRYNENTMADVQISIEYNSNEPRTKDLCIRYLLGELVDACYHPADNPANYKAGGTAILGDVTFKIEPQANRQDTRPGVDMGCSSAYKGFYNEYWVWGHGFASDDWGENLENQLKGCALFPNTWGFGYGLGDNGREWSVHFKTGVFQKHCVGNALHTAGAPADKWCSGSG